MADIEVNEKSLTSYKQDSKEKCWYDECTCEDILVADCDALTEENNKGVGRFACMAEEQNCYNPKFIASFMKKLACQLDHMIENICGLWDMVACMQQYMKSIGDIGKSSTIYLRNSTVSSASFYHSATDEYDLDIYMDSVTGVVRGESDDKRRKLTDGRYRAYIRWCADGNNLVSTADNTMTFTVYTSGETYNDDMNKKRSIHWQMKGVTDGAMEISDSIILEKGQYLRVRVAPANNNSASTFRVHQFKVEYAPVIDGGTLPDCLK